MERIRQSKWLMLTSQHHQVKSAPEVEPDPFPNHHFPLVWRVKVVEIFFVRPNPKLKTNNSPKSSWLNINALTNWFFTIKEKKAQMFLLFLKLHKDPPAPLSSGWKRRRSKHLFQGFVERGLRKVLLNFHPLSRSQINPGVGHRNGPFKEIFVLTWWQFSESELCVLKSKMNIVRLWPSNKQTAGLHFTQGSRRTF